MLTFVYWLLGAHCCESALISRDSGTLLDSERVAWRACQTPLVPAAKAARGSAFLSKVSASPSL